MPYEHPQRARSGGQRQTQPALYLALLQLTDLLPLQFASPLHWIDHYLLVALRFGGRHVLEAEEDGVDDAAPSVLDELLEVGEAGALDGEGLALLGDLGCGALGEGPEGQRV
jgi:hypothetical protein